MTGFIDGHEIELPCKGCGRKTKKSIGWIKANNKFVCGCGDEIIIDASQFKTEIAKLENSFAGVQGMLKKFNK